MKVTVNIPQSPFNAGGGRVGSSPQTGGDCFPRSPLWDESGLGMQQGATAAWGCHLQQPLWVHFLERWGFGLSFAPMPAGPSHCSDGVALLWELHWQCGHPWLRVISRYELGFWRRINTFSLQKTLTTKFCVKGQCQRSHAQPGIKQSQALSQQHDTPPLQLDFQGPGWRKRWRYISNPWRTTFGGFRFQ